MKNNNRENYGCILIAENWDVSESSRKLFSIAISKTIF